jgi:hypothetical protein
MSRDDSVRGKLFRVVVDPEGRLVDPHDRPLELGAILTGDHIFEAAWTRSINSGGLDVPTLAYSMPPRTSLRGVPRSWVAPYETDEAIEGFATALVGYLLTAATALMLLLAWPSTAQAGGTTEVRGRTIRQAGGTWHVIYSLAYRGDKPCLLRHSEMSGTISGLVSNSRSRGHGRPLDPGGPYFDAKLLLDGPRGIDHCREIRMAFLLPGSASPFTDALEPRDLAVRPGDAFYCVLQLQHIHDVTGAWDPLLGTRRLSFRCGPIAFEDTIPLDREKSPAATPHVRFPAFPERMSSKYYRTPPDSILLSQAIAGKQYLGLPEIRVRYGSTILIRFHYLIARGSDPLHARFTQYMDCMGTWRVLGADTEDGAGFDEQLKGEGTWREYKRRVKLSHQTTTIRLDIRFVEDAGAGDAWIDDIEIIPLHGPKPEGGP